MNGLPDDAARARGRHTIFLGYAVGVGKTHAMLVEAGRRAQQGDDVMIGYLEPRPRPETRALAEGLDVIPPRVIEYHGAQFPELDTQRIILRHPDLVIVDELAHTNTPGAGPDKRWESIDEILSAGIDVFSTINAQHFESVAPTVSQILGVIVRETVPDRMLDDADEVRLIDIEPEALLSRAKQGLVYPAEEIGSALGHTLRRPNLIALREIARRLVRERRGDKD
jgi:two-component system sensor histidine kinase KdpD